MSSQPPKLPRLPKLPVMPLEGSMFDESTPLGKWAIQIKQAIKEAKQEKMEDFT